MLSPKFPNVYLDLLFNAVGIEKEIVALSELIYILPEVEVKVASISCLIAMKVLSSNNDTRLQDVIDLQHLINEAAKKELIEAESLVTLIVQRGYHGDQDLIEKFQNYRERFSLPLK